MELDRNLLKEFAKITNDSEVKSESKYLRGTIVKTSGGKYVQIDGSTTVTPIAEVVDVDEGDRVLVSIENHKATIIGNFTYSPSARKEQEAITKAEEAKSAAESVTDTANVAQQKAQEASDKADIAMDKASISSTSSDEAKEQAAEALAKANAAQEDISEAKELAEQASTDASEAKTQAAASQAASAEAQAEVTKIQGDVDAAKEDINKAVADLEAQADEIDTIKETYSTKVEVGNTKAELETTITTKVGELETTVSETYSTKTENVELEGRLQTQITQNAEGITSHASKIEELEADTTKAQEDVAEALSKAGAAQTAADNAQAAADNAQAAANSAQANADAASEKATLAQNAADAAQTAADEADQAVQAAQSDLNEAKENLANVTSRVDATEADIAEAQSKVDQAQVDVNQALADAAEANLAATNAQEAADKAQQDAETAQGLANTAQQKADNAQTAADNAQSAADKAQADVSALTSRVTTAETNISQNAENITLNANKTTEIGEKLDNLEIGGRNYIVDSDTTYTLSFNANSYKATSLPISPELPNIDSSIRTFTISYDAYSENGGVTLQGYLRASDSMRAMSASPALGISTTSWARYSRVATINDGYTIADIVSLYLRVEGTTADTVYIKNVKVEIGNKATDWTPAPEDIENELSTNYYNKTETDAKIQVESDRITSVVTEIETVEKNSIISTVEEFYLSTSATELSGGSWSTDQPEWTEGMYIWKRTCITKGDGTISYQPSQNGMCMSAEDMKMIKDFEGEEIHLTDSGEYSFVKISMKGKTEQDTRSGKNRLNLYSVSGSYNDVAPTLTNGVINVKGTNNTDYNNKETYKNGFVHINTVDEWEDEVTYYFSCKVEVVSNQKNLDTSYFSCFLYGQAGFIINYNEETGRYEGKVTNVTGTSEKSKYVEFRLDGCELNISEIMLTTENTYEYEPYGVSPSPEYSSNIENVEAKNLCSMSVLDDMNSNGASNTYDSTTHTITFDVDPTGNSGRYKTYNWGLTVGENYTMSFEIKGTAGKKVYCGWNTKRVTITLTENYIKYSTTIQATKSNEPIVFYSPTPDNGGLASGEYMQFNNVQIEKGMVPTDYTPYNSLEVKVKDKNLLKVTDTDNLSFNGASANVKNGIINANGTTTSTGNVYFDIFEVPTDGDYTLSLRIQGYTTRTSTNCSMLLQVSDNKKTFSNVKELSFGNSTLRHSVVSLYKNKYYRLRIYLYSDSVFTNATIKVQLEKGLELTDFEPYKEQTAYFPLAEGQKLMEGSYLAEDGVHNKKVQVVFDGTETWFFNASQGMNRFYMTLNKPALLGGADVITTLCTHFKYVYGYENYNFYISTDKTKIFFNDNDFSTVAEWKTYLAELYANGTPVIVEYELAEEIVPYTEEQQEAWNKIQALFTYNRVTYVYSHDTLKPIFYGTYYTYASDEVNTILNNEATNIRKEIQTATTNIIQDTNKITMEALEEYVTTGDFETYKGTVLTQFEQTKDAFNLTFKSTEETINTLDEDTQKQFREIQKYIRFVDGNIVLGEAGNELTLKIQNDRISFLQSNSEVAYFSNNKLYVTDGEFLNSLQVGKFAFKPRANGSLSFGKVSS